MAIVNRYFSTAAAGSGDGTTWADRAELLPSGSWSSVIIDYDFVTTGNGMLVHIGPGTYACSQALTGAIFSVSQPSIANPLTLHGCDSSGVLLTPPNPAWSAAQPCDFESALPVIATTTNIAAFGMGAYFRLLKFTASGRSGAAVATAFGIFWCVIENSTANLNASCNDGNAVRMINVVGRCTGSSYNFIFAEGSTGYRKNCRAEGNASATTGNRYGIAMGGTSGVTHVGDVAINNPGGGFFSLNTNAASRGEITNIMAINNAAGGLILQATASQTNPWIIEGGVFTGNGGYGVDGGAARVWLINCRFRDNTSGASTGTDNYPVSVDNLTSAGTDANEYVDAANGDYRIKAGSAIWGKGYGAGDQLDFPAVGNVHTDDTTNGATGTLTLPTAAQVESGVQFGAGGTEFTGTLTGGAGGGGSTWFSGE